MMAKLSWEEPETLEGLRQLTDKAEERRAARAQEMSPACCARENGGGKGGIGIVSAQQ
jgi:hypothetical protein